VWRASPARGCYHADVVARAVGWSVALHALALLVLALAWPRLRAVDKDKDAVTSDAWIAAARSLATPDPEAERREPPTVIELRTPADVTLAVAHPGAPTTAPNLDPTAGAAAASSGHGAGAPTLVTERADAATLRVQPFDAASGYAMQRIATGHERLSREQVRATPHAASLPWLSSAQRGHGHAEADLEQRTRPSDATRRDEPDHAPPIESRRQTAGFARPDVARAPASTDAAEDSDDVADRVDRALVSDEKQPAPLELSRPTSPGAETSGQGVTAGALGYAPRAEGRAPVPTGAPSLPDAQALAAATYQRIYDLYLSRVKQKVDPLWEFPRELAIRMEQGDVLVGFTIKKDGSVRDLRVLKGSGFPSFDKNVLAAVKKAAPFAPLPATFGAELKVTAPFEGSNPAIR
jgi:protein TonB